MFLCAVFYFKYVLGPFLSIGKKRCPPDKRKQKQTAVSTV